jgi:putative peptide maturation system protein
VGRDRYLTAAVHVLGAMPSAPTRVSVDGVVLSVADAVAQLDMLWERTDLMQRLIDRCLVDAALAREPVDVTDDDVQQALDGMRRGRGLLSVAALEAWMADTGTTWHLLETMATQLARTAKLRERVVGSRIDEALAGDLRSYDVVAMATVRTGSRAAAEAVRDAAGSGGRGLLCEAQQSFASGGEGIAETALRRVRRHELDAAIERAVAAAGIALDEGAAGRMLGPIAVDDGWLLAEVIAVEPARPGDPELRRLVRSRLFDEWLRERRRSARIEWLWGRADGAPDAAG